MTRGRDSTHYDKIVPLHDEGTGDKHGPEDSFLVLYQSLPERQLVICLISQSCLLNQTLVVGPKSLSHLAVIDLDHWRRGSPPFNLCVCHRKGVAVCGAVWTEVDVERCVDDKMTLDEDQTDR